MVKTTEQSVGVCSFLNGYLFVKGSASAVESIEFTTNKSEEVSGDGEVAKAIVQLKEYMTHQRTTFDVVLNPKVTPFRRKVYDVLMTIPYGQLWTYKDIAVAMGQPNASRAVGMAMNKNPCMLIWPCHRVVGVNRKLTGFAGGIDLKKEILGLEGVNLDGYR